jgi:predicted lipoprotein with Yx(FWY)xxD motif
MEYSGEKKSLVQMMLMYVLIGGVIYGAIYLLFFMNKPNYQSAVTPNTNQVATQVNPTTSVSDMVMFKNDMNKGNLLVDTKGMTFYVFDKDTVGVSNCYQTCATLWPPFTFTGTAKISQNNLSQLTRTDGTYQYTWMGKPLYYYSKDTKVGDITGDGFGGIWHIVSK